MTFLYPWALFGLASLGGIVFLHMFVFRGQRRQVSSLHLWQARHSQRLEGEQKRKPPVTLPLILELLCALLLVLLISGLVRSGTDSLSHIVVVLDSSASMNAQTDKGATRDAAVAAVDAQLQRLDKRGRVTLVASGFEPGIIGGESLPADAARRALADWRPAGPTHALQPSVDLARALAGERSIPMLVTDHIVAHDGVQLAAVGRPVENTGWIAARWIGGGKVFALVQYFGDTPGQSEVVLHGPDAPLSRTEVDFTRATSVPLTFEAPDGVDTLRLTLPDDALPNDNTLWLTRPKRPRLLVALRLDDELLTGYVRRAVLATGEAEPSDSDLADIVFCAETAPDTDAPLVVRLHAADAATAQGYSGPFIVGAHDDLTAGVDLDGVIWAADPKFRAAEGSVSLLSAGEVPLLVRDGRTLTLNLLPKGSNVFTAPAWPVLINNMVRRVRDAAPGLRRSSYRLGESLTLRRPRAWQGEVSIERPDGSRTEFAGNPIRYGRLEREGVYRIHTDSGVVATFNVNLLSDAESDLTGAATSDLTGSLRPAEREERTAHPLQRELGLPMLAMLLLAWTLLERRRR
jgi:Aerotolerance regulator N-terminal